jgi:hypothetical protein
MSSAFVELLRKSNLDLVAVRKPFKIGSRSDDIVFASLIDTKIKKLQVRHHVLVIHMSMEIGRVS